jgi:nitrogen fixation NifU-like protein
MDSALTELYQEIILEHNRAPHNKCRLQPPAVFARGHNPSCGDDITVFVELDGGIVKRIAFDGEGCAISQASASLMTDLLIGRTKKDAAGIISAVCSLLTADNSDGVVESDNPLEIYGDVAALLGVRKFPMRLKCATLPWHAANDALSGG